MRVLAHSCSLLFTGRFYPFPLLRGEQRNTDTPAYHLNHLNQRILKMPRVANPS